jgi:hypothetical protein
MRWTVPGPQRRVKEGRGSSLEAAEAIAIALIESPGVAS